MKVKRLKRASRVLTFFRYNYGFQAPYSLLLDGTFAQTALKTKINLREQMPKYLAAEVQMLVSQCTLNELEQLGKPVYGALVICQQFAVAKCPHKPMRTAAECIAHLARRSRKEGSTKYLVGTQDDALLEKLRQTGGIPVMSIRFNTILLEKPSEQSLMEAENKPSEELEKVREMRTQLLGEGSVRRRKRKGPKGPNPLSCKKKRKPNGGGGTASGGRRSKDENQGKEVPATKGNLDAKERAKLRKIRKRLLTQEATETAEGPIR